MAPSQPPEQQQQQQKQQQPLFTNNNSHDDTNKKNMTRRQRQSFSYFVVVVVLLSSLLGRIGEASSSSNPSSFVLRIRRLDGSIQRIGFESQEEASSLTLSQVLQHVEQEQQEQQVQCSIRYHKGTTTTTCDEPQTTTLEQLGIRHGALLSLVPRNKGTSSSSVGLQQKKKTSQTKHEKDRWNPFPELAKDYKGTMRQIQRRKATSSQLSYADLSALHASLHTVEPQSEGHIHRFHMCQTAAERFVQSSSSSSSHQARVALLFGTLHRERRDPKRIKHKTSLSSTTEAEDYCQVAKVQAMWEPPQQPSEYYDATQLLDFVQTKKVVDVAQWLGLVPVGWIYSYPELRSSSSTAKKDNDNNEGALPVFGIDLETGARLQIACMKWLGCEEGSRFVTVAMHAHTGATEAFQLSDVAVQMVAEDMLLLDNKKHKKEPPAPQRHVTTRHALLVDGQETTQLDSVLCLINTALLSHQGMYTSSSNNNDWGVKKNNPYQLTKKARKALDKAINDDDLHKDHSKVLELLANFNILVALYDDLPSAEMRQLVETVRKWARGQKKSTRIDPKIIQLLQQIFT